MLLWAFVIIVAVHDLTVRSALHNIQLTILIDGTGAMRVRQIIMSVLSRFICESHTLQLYIASHFPRNAAKPSSSKY
jgi:hypothetical protein